MSRKMANASSRNKSKVFDRLIGDDVSEVDPSYKIFLEHLCQEGNSYAFDAPDGGHGMPASVRYEEDDNISCVVAMDKDCTNVPNSSRRRYRGGSNAKLPGVTSGRDAHINVKAVTAPTDESYAAFLSLLKIKDGFMVIELEPGVTVAYEQEEETPVGYDEMSTVSSAKDRKHSMNAPQNMVEDNAMHGDEDRHRQTDNIICEHATGRPPPDNLDSQDLTCTDEHGLAPCTESSDLNVYEDDQRSPIAFSCGVPSTFDEKLDYVLSQPYDQNEYEELLRKATDRKPVSRQKHLRSVSKRYATGVLGLSYLDHYPDLATQIDSADTDEGRLNLLRKFFFWLENLSHEGAHMPWIAKALSCDPIVADDYE
uniref:Uncharacterized protein n=2 Tax=Avena sativa TaxID=4498 RepID=A0ACD5THG6_AVESA